MNKKIIVCGTGRCGTKSMQVLLGACKNSISTHEFSPILDWDFNEEQFQERVKHFKNINVKYYSDTGAWYLNYLERFIQEFPDIKIIVLVRDIQKVIKSYKEKVKTHNFWNNQHTDGSEPHEDYDRGFPDYGDMPIDDALEKFWIDYYDKVEELRKKYPDNIGIFDTVTLNSIMWQTHIYNFIGIEKDDKVHLNNIRENNILNL